MTAYSWTDLPDDALCIVQCKCMEWVVPKAAVSAGGRCGLCNVRTEKTAEYDGRKDWARRLDFGASDA